MTEFDALSHALAAISTGGMGNYDSSFAGFSPALRDRRPVFMLLGSFSFIRFVQTARAIHRPARPPGPHVPGDCRPGGAVAAALLSATPSTAGRRLGAAFNVVSVMTTTGYATPTICSGAIARGRLRPQLSSAAAPARPPAGSRSSAPGVWRDLRRRPPPAHPTVMSRASPGAACRRRRGLGGGVLLVLPDAGLAPSR